MRTPYFIFKPVVLERKYFEFDNLCKKYFKNYIIAYSVKTNSYPGVMKSLDRLGSGFDSASIDEMKMTSFSKNKKFFNGPCKTIDELKYAIKNNFIINVDSLSEIGKIAEITEGIPFEIGIRVSFKESKFGFEAIKVKEAIEYALSRNIKTKGFHFHAGTQLSLQQFEKNVIETAKFLKSIDFPIDYIDIGGGFPDKFHLHNLGVTLEDYFKTLMEILKISPKTSIVFEPGRFLVSDAFDIISKVHVIKKNYDDTYAIIDAGINVLSKISLSKFKFSKLNDKRIERKQEYILAGPLLFGNDVLGRYTGFLNEGDIMRIENVGAYCYNLAWEISYRKPKIIIER